MFSTQIWCQSTVQDLLSVYKATCIFRFDKCVEIITEDWHIQSKSFRGWKRNVSALMMNAGAIVTENDTPPTAGI